MDSPAISRIRFRDPTGGHIGIPDEWAEAWAECLVPAERWLGAALTCQDRALSLSLARLGNEVCVVAAWPRAGCGHYRLRLALDGTIEERVITIRPRKIGRDSFARMLEDLEFRLPASIAIGLKRGGAMAGVEILPPGEATLEGEIVRLRRAVLGIPGRPGLASVLGQLASDPHRVLRTTEHWVASEQARRPHPARLVQALSRGHNLDRDRHPRRVLDTRAEHTADVYENRVIALYQHLVRRRLARVIHLLRAGGRATLLPEVLALDQELGRARRRASFLDAVQIPARPPASVTMVLLNRAPYRAGFEGYLEFHRSTAVRLETPALDAPLRELPALYQLWGTLEVLVVALEVGAALGYTVLTQHLVRRDGGGLFVRVLPDGQPSLVLQHPFHRTVVRCIPERTYGRGRGLHSISFEQRPDLAIEVEVPDQPPRIYLFDPKYKLDGDKGDGKPVKADLDKMHAYRDAIRTDRGRRTVRHAAILYPGPHVQYADGLEALPAYPGDANRLAILRARLREVLRQALSAGEAHG